MEPVIPLLILAVAAVVISVVVYSHIAARKRREAIMLWAARHGLSFRPPKDRGFDDRFHEFKCLTEGANRYAENIAEGDWRGRGVVTFDYHYETYSTDSKGRRQTHHHYFSGVIVRSNMPMKPLLIRTENLWDKVASFFGKSDINFESAEFSRRYFVKSPDRKWAYDVLHTRAIEFLLSQPAYSLEFEDRHIIAWRKSRFDPHEFEQAINIIVGLLDQLPQYVREQMKGAS